MSLSLQHALQEQIRVLSEDEMRQVLSFVNGLHQEKAIPQAKTISAIFEDLSKEVSLEEWSELPSDGAENHDHYLYGTPKKTKQ